jgi:hypothetical protein
MTEVYQTRLDEEVHEQVERFRTDREHEISRAEATRRLIHAGLEAEQGGHSTGGSDAAESDGSLIDRIPSPIDVPDPTTPLERFTDGAYRLATVALGVLLLTGIPLAVVSLTVPIETVVATLTPLGTVLSLLLVYGTMTLFVLFIAAALLGELALGTDLDSDLTDTGATDEQ